MERQTETFLDAAQTQLDQPEGTRPGRILTPAVDIFETPAAIVVMADMPGVAPDALSIDLNEGVLTITGHADVPEGDSEVWIAREYGAGTFQRKFTLSQSIDQAKIDARLVDGVLRLELPKVEKAKPRKIAVTGS